MRAGTPTLRNGLAMDLGAVGLSRPYEFPRTIRGSCNIQGAAFQTGLFRATNPDLPPFVVSRARVFGDPCRTTPPHAATTPPSRRPRPGPSTMVNPSAPKLPLAPHPDKMLPTSAPSVRAEPVEPPRPKAAPNPPSQSPSSPVASSPLTPLSPLPAPSPVLRPTLPSPPHSSLNAHSAQLTPSPTPCHRYSDRVP